MSVDYEPVLIYGYEIPLTDKNCAAMFQVTQKEYWELKESIDDQFEEIRFIDNNGYSDPSYIYFGVPLGDEISLDPTEVKYWIKNQQYEIMSAFTKVFGDELYEELGSPELKLYNFVRPW